MLGISLLLALVAGCGREAPVAPSVSSRIVSLAPSLTEILFAIGGGDNVVGVTTQCNYPPEARARENVGDITVDLEKLTLLKPDLIVADAALNRLRIDELRRRGFAVRVYGCESIEAVLQTIREVGKECRREKEALALTADLRRTIDAVRAKGATAKRRPRILFEVGSDPIFVAGPGNHIDDAIRLCGGENVAAALPLAWGAVGPETVVAWDPDMILLCHTDRATVDRRPGWNNLRAVREDKVVAVDPDLFARPSIRFLRNIDRLFAAIQGKK